MNTTPKKDGRYLIDSYVEEVGSKLPHRQREDIQAEIRSLLEDTLEDRLRETGQEADVDMVASLLQEFGSPAKMALSYAPDRYLVGPQLFSLFLLVLKIVFSVILVLGAIGTGIALSQASSVTEGTDILIQNLIDLAGTFMMVFANIVIVFAILERLLPEKDKLDEEWDPRKLEPLPNHDKLKPVELIIDMAFATAGIVVFNFFPQVLRGVMIHNGQVQTLQLLDTNFTRFIPWLSALWVLEILFSVLLLWRQRWEVPTRWGRITLDLLGMALLATMLFGGSLLASNAEAATNGSLETLTGVIEMGLKIGLGIALVLEAVSVVENLFKLRKKKI